jgi:bleomycin hydrolase
MKYDLNEKVKKVDQAHFYFTDLIDLEHTPVKSQVGAGNCWSYATNSFLESEMMRMGKKPYDLSCLFSLRCAYVERAENYLRMRGGIAWGEGGECHDVLNMYALYGAIPTEVYPGPHSDLNNERLADLNKALKSFLDKVLDMPGTELAHDWRQAFDAILNSYIGDVPDKFNFDSHNFNPATFARKCVGIHPEDYVELASVTYRPYYKEMTLLVPDNWSFNRVYNIKMDDITDVIDRALSRGYSLVWEADISEHSFDWKKGLAFVPEKNFDEMTARERKEMFSGPKFEKFISPEFRQIAIDNMETTDDHAMHIIGLAEDQNHKKYYKVKNSWGPNNAYGGYIYVTKTYVRYKTTSILLHKAALSVEMRNNLNLATTGNTRIFYR